MRVHRIRQIQGYLGDREMTHKLVNDVAPRYARAQRRLHAHPQARRPPGRRRRDGPHRARLSSVVVRRDPAATAVDLRRDRLAAMRRVRLTVAYDGARSTGSPPTPACAPCWATWPTAIATVVRQPVELTGAGRTDAGVHAWGQVVSGDLPADTDLDDLARRLNKLCAPGDRRARRGVGRRRLRRPVLGVVAPLPLRRVERADAEPAARRPGVVRRPSRSPVWAMQAACDPLSASTTSPRSAGGPRSPTASRAVAGAARARPPAGRRSTTTGAPALRDPGQRVLPPDGALDRRHARRRRPRARRRPATSAASSSPATARPPARSPRRTASCCGRSATRRRPRTRRAPTTTVRSRPCRSSSSRPTRSSTGCARPATASGGHGRRWSMPCARRQGAFTADELAAAVPDVHVSTVYRTLGLLEEIGAVRHVHLSHGPALYEQRRRRAEVRHLVCEVCGRHVAVPSSAVRPPCASASPGLRLRARRLPLRHRRPLLAPAPDS